MKIGIDAMGGDFAPAEAINGVKNFLLEAGNDVHLVMLGDEAQLNPLLADANLPSGSYSVVHAPQVIGMHEHPTKALKEKPQSSIAIGFGLLAKEKFDAFISAGNTVAMLGGSLFSLKTLEGVLRPTISR